MAILHRRSNHIMLQYDTIFPAFNQTSATLERGVGSISAVQRSINYD